MFTGGQKEFTQIPKVASGLEGTESADEQLVSKAYVDNSEVSGLWVDQKSTGASGGSSSSGANIRALNTEIRNSAPDEFFKLHRLDISGGYSQLPVEGETLTGGSSGAVGTVHYVGGTSSVYVRSVTGAFTTSENVTGSAGADFDVSLAAGFTNYVGILNPAASSRVYKMEALASVYKDNGSQLQIRVEGTGGSETFYGLSMYAGGISADAGGISICPRAHLSISAGGAAVVRLVHYIYNAHSSGLGIPKGLSEPEIYASLEIIRSR